MEIGIRPEHVGVAALVGGERDAATLVAIEPMGAESLLSFDAGGQTVQARLPAVRVDRLNLAIGAAVSLHFPTDFVYLFDPASGRTLLQAGLVERQREAA